MTTNVIFTSILLTITCSIVKDKLAKKYVVIFYEHDKVLLFPNFKNMRTTQKKTYLLI